MKKEGEPYGLPPIISCLKRLRLLFELEYSNFLQHINNQTPDFFDRRDIDPFAR